jgi:prephenate dehydratase
MEKKMGLISVAFQGEHGAYSEMAAMEYFGAEIGTLPCSSFDSVFAAVRDGDSALGLVPIENSLAGSIHRNYDLLMRYDLSICGEYYLRVSHCLMALPQVSLSEIKYVYSHPQALAQCEASLAALGVEGIAKYDTAGSARLICEQNDIAAGALASRHAASVYGLNVLKEKMEDNPANYTRFLVLTRAFDKQTKDKNNPHKTSLVFSLQNKPGALYRALSIFALREIDLTKIESRPLTGKPWEYFFYIDFAGHSESEVCSEALAHLDDISDFLRVLGSYPRHIFQVVQRD